MPRKPAQELHSICFWYALAVCAVARRIAGGVPFDRNEPFALSWRHEDVQTIGTSPFGLVPTLCEKNLLLSAPYWILATSRTLRGRSNTPRLRLVDTSPPKGAGPNSIVFQVGVDPVKLFAGVMEAAGLGLFEGIRHHGDVPKRIRRHGGPEPLMCALENWSIDMREFILSAEREAAREMLRKAWDSLVTAAAGQEEAARTKAAVEQTAEAARPGAEQPPPEEMLWTRLHCPSCGARGIEFISQREFARRAGTTHATVGRRIKRGRYRHDRSGKVPWCLLCQAKTPEGRGVEESVDAVPADSYVPPAEYARKALEWAADVVAGPLKLPRPDPDLPPAQDDAKEHEAYELMDVGATAILVRVRENGEPLTELAAKDVARSAIRKHRRKEYQSRVYHSKGTMDSPVKPSEREE